jgi:hypothetical protein
LSRSTAGTNISRPWRYSDVAARRLSPLHRRLRSHIEAHDDAQEAPTRRLGASFVLILYVVAKAVGHPIPDRGFGDAALCIVILSLAVWVACAMVALIVDAARR